MTRLPSSPLRLTVTSAHHRRLTVAVAGDLGFENADQLADTVARALRGGPVGDAAVPAAGATSAEPATAERRLVLDMTGLTHFDSYALSVLLSLRGTAAEHGMRLVLDHRPAHLDRLLRRTGVHPLFDEPALPAPERQAQAVPDHER
ncbi:STAS domain-containing protein [Saccharothrix sp. 6-C]|uniref:STAS domain-containing protein n=1 Tax=Saccharothrix sp. 6-C TaxID=2781735 RepID=UPI00191788A3|nr:STAS domain-containing protein [Saccharothrix sp. 6-C]QQQ74241.1 STAS domain-containing protein [Saccharothrix sp. 6-C]